MLKHQQQAAPVAAATAATAAAAAAAVARIRDKATSRRDLVPFFACFAFSAANKLAIL